MGLLFGVFVQSIFLPDLCAPSYPSKAEIALIADVFILARILVGWCFKEKGLAWVFYAILPTLMVPTIEIAIRIRFPTGCSGC